MANIYDQDKPLTVAEAEKIVLTQAKDFAWKHADAVFYSRPMPSAARLIRAVLDLDDLETEITDG